VGNSIRRRHAAHFDGHIPGLGTVVDLGQKVAMDVDHDVVFTALNNLSKSTCNTTIRTHPAAEHSEPSAARLFQSGVVAGLCPARGEAPSPHVHSLAAPTAHPTQRFMGVPFAVNRDAIGRGAVASSRLLVHDSEHDLFVLILDVEEQVRK